MAKKDFSKRIQKRWRTKVEKELEKRKRDAAAFASGLSVTFILSHDDEKRIHPMKNFLESADSRETDQEIIDAIWWLANEDEAKAERIWQDPTNEEMLAIWERVTKNGLVPAYEFCWGESGSHWADWRIIAGE